MRIISKFHDYYDRAMGLGQDRTVVFVRHTENVKDAPAIMEPPYHFDRHSRDWTARCEPFTIGFCGKVYRGIAADLQYRDYEAGVANVRHCFYDLDDLAEFLAAKKMDLGAVKGKRRGWRWSYRQGWQEFMEKPQGEVSAEAWFIECKVALLAWDRALMIGKELGIVRNPRLKNYEFFRVFEPFQTFQELSMFIGGVLPGADADMAKVSDKDRLAQRGFDKWSFRKMPEAK